MQQLNVLATKSVKAIDLKEEQKSSFSNSNKNDSFSVLVEKQLTSDDTKVKAFETAQSKNNDVKTSSENKVAKDNLAAKNEQANATNTKNNDDNVSEKNQAETLVQPEQENQSELDSVENYLSADELASEVKKGKAENFELSQQFLSLLYSADATLVDTELSQEQKALLGDNEGGDKTGQLSLALENKRVLQELLLTDQEKSIQAENAKLSLENGNDVSATSTAKELPAKLGVNTISEQLLASMVDEKNIKKEKFIELEGGSKGKAEEPIYTILPIKDPAEQLSGDAVDETGDELILAATKNVASQKNDRTDGPITPQQADESIELSSKLLDQVIKPVITENTTTVTPSKDASKITELTSSTQQNNLTSEQAKANIELALQQSQNNSEIDAIANAVPIQAAVASNSNQAETLRAQINRQNITENSAKASQEQFAEAKNAVNNDLGIIDSLATDAINIANEAKPTVVTDVKITSTLADLSITRMSNDVATLATQALENTTQQSIDALNHNIASDVVPIQKNNVSLQQETIAIFRKDFADAVKEKVMVMISQKLQQFDIRLDPPEFGNMHVRINLQNEQAIVNFTVQNQQAKEALEQNMGKLRDMLAEQGVNCGEADVQQQSQQAFSNEQNSGHSAQGDSLLSDDEIAQADGFMSIDMANKSASGVDFYA